MTKYAWAVRLAMLAGSVAVFLLLPAEGRWTGRILFIGVPLAVLAVFEWWLLRLRERQGIQTLAQTLGLTAEPGLTSDTLHGTLGKFELRYQSDATNELGRPACLELKLPPGPWSGWSLGPKKMSYRLKKASGDADPVTLHPDLVAFAPSSGRVALEALPKEGRLLTLAVPQLQIGRWGAALFDSKLVTARYGRFPTPELLRSFLEEAIAAAEELMAGAGEKRQ